MNNFEIIKENLPNVDLNAAIAKKRVEEVLTKIFNNNRKYLNCICEGEYYDEIRNINIYNHGTANIGEIYLIEADVHFDDGKFNHGWESITNVIIPVEYITDENKLKAASEDYQKELKEKRKFREEKKQRI